MNPNTGLGENPTSALKNLAQSVDLTERPTLKEVPVKWMESFGRFLIRSLVPEMSEITISFRYGDQRVTGRCLFGEDGEWQPVEWTSKLEK